jgi:outer membrane protein OmpA-like peptidoglycan-associated protein
MFPFIAGNGTLYFSSDGHTGLGGLDVFSSKFQNGSWLRPQNLGAPINTNTDDFDYVIKDDNKHGYFCSNRPGGAGDDDIYSFVRKAIEAKGLVYNAYTGDAIEGASVTANPPVEGSLGSDKAGKFNFTGEPDIEYAFTSSKEGFYPANIKTQITETANTVRIPMYPIGDIKLEVTVIDKKTKQPLDSSEVKITNLRLSKAETLWTDKQGKCYLVLDTNTTYAMDVSKETGLKNEKYLSISVSTSSKGVNPPAVIRELVELDKVKLNVPIKIENIYYDLDKWFIRPDAATELNRLVKILKDNPTIEIELSSHTDCRATAKYNQNLSQKRAQSAVDYIASQGVDIKRMAAAGYGESKPVNNCRCEGSTKVPCTEVQHQENRRTEFKVVKF